MKVCKENLKDKNLVRNILMIANMVYLKKIGLNYKNKRIVIKLRRNRKSNKLLKKIKQKSKKKKKIKKIKMMKKYQI